MPDVTIYHNRNCGTSRTVLQMLRDAGIEPEIVEYLKTPLDASALGELLDILEDPPGDLVRKDGFFSQQGPDAGDYAEPAAVIDLLVRYPRLMQRPVVASGRRALIARPKERALDILP